MGEMVEEIVLELLGLFLVRVDLELCEAEELREAELQRKYSHAAVNAQCCPAGANRGKELSDHTEHCTSGG